MSSKPEKVGLLAAVQSSPSVAKEAETQDKEKAFEKEILSNIIKHEGGYQNHKEDKKGNTNSKGERVGTNWGISAPVYEQYIGKPPTVEDMKNMPKEHALEIYRKKYIEPVEKVYGFSPDHPAYKQVVDMGVNHSPQAVASMIQRATGAKVDGIAGPLTRASVGKIDPEVLNDLLVDKRRDYYEQLMRSNPDFEKYRKGWLKRAESFR